MNANGSPDKGGVKKRRGLNPVRSSAQQGIVRDLTGLNRVEVISVSI